VLTPVHRRYLLIETSISVVINSALSLFFAWVVFGQREVIELGGSDGLAVDFLPQTFMVALMSTLVPSFLTRKRVRQSQLAGLASAPLRLPRNLLLRALLVAVVAVVVLGLAALLLTPVLATDPMSRAAAFASKVLYGAIISVPITLLALRCALADTKPAPATPNQ
jgi:hypothetical protein